MHWQLGEIEMASRAGTVPFSITPSSSINPANVSSSSLASGVERSGSGYAALELIAGSYGASDDPGRASEERELTQGGRRRRPASAQMMQGQQLAPVAPGIESGPVMLPSLAELTGGVPAFSGFVGDRRHRGEAEQVRHPLRVERASQQDVGSRRRGSDEPAIKEEVKEESQRRQ